MLRETVTEMFQVWTTKCQESATVVHAARLAVEQAKAHLHQATDHDAYTRCAETRLRSKHQELLDYCSGLPQKPQAFLETMQRLDAEHAQAIGACREAQFSVQQRKDALEKAEIKLLMAEAEAHKLQSQLQEVIEHLQQIT